MKWPSRTLHYLLYFFVNEKDQSCFFGGSFYIILWFLKSDNFLFVFKNFFFIDHVFIGCTFIKVQTTKRWQCTISNDRTQCDLPNFYSDGIRVCSENYWKICFFTILEWQPVIKLFILVNYLKLYILFICIYIKNKL